MNIPYHFPTFAQFVAGEARLIKRFRQGIRFYSARLCHFRQVKQFETLLNHNPQWQSLFTAYPYRCNTLLRKFCDNRLTAQQRLELIQANLRLAEHYWGRSLCQQLLEQQSLDIAQLNDQLLVKLKINPIEPCEGLFSFSLRSIDDKEIYDASFGFLPNGKLLIGSLQGTNSPDSQQVIKWATKTLNGIRPMFFMLMLFQIASQEWGLELMGIGHKNQCKYRFNDHSKLLFNYDSFWQENQGVKGKKYWHLPNVITVKKLEMIESKKRSMYRKRYAMLDALQQQFHLFFKEAL